MRKPTRPPPPPPPPPRNRSPARSCCSLPRQAGSCAGGSCSEYAESVYSMPSYLVQTPIRQYISPATSAYQSCRSETAFSQQDLDTTGNNYCTLCCPTTPCNFPETCCANRCPAPPYTPQIVHHQTPHPHLALHCSPSLLPASCNNQFRSRSPCPTNHSHQSNHNLSSHNSSIHIHGHICSPVKPIAYQPTQPSPVPPTPRVRISRPRLSISPIPVLNKKRNSNNYKETRVQDKCKSHQYRRHVERRVEKIFNYLKNREQRRKECYDGLAGTGSNAKTIVDVLNSDESYYLRSLRARISTDDFQVIQKLGSGFIGTVFLVKKKPVDESTDGPADLYAMKKLKISQVVQQDHLAHVMAERDILAEANSEWIVKLYYSFQDSDFLYLIMDYIPGGDMMTLLSIQNVFPEEWARFYIAEISLALQFVHDMGFIHRDIKPDNILIDKDGHIKLTDFGLCTGNRWTHDSRYYRVDTSHNTMVQYNGNNGFDQDHPTITKALTKREIEHSSRGRALSLVGSPNYIAPEVLRQACGLPEGTNQRLCDWWSVGVILYEMVIGYCPFIDLQMLRQNDRYDASEDPPQNIQARILNWKDYLEFPSREDRNGPPQQADKTGAVRYISEPTKNLIKGLLCDPEDRLCQDGICDIMDHPFFKGPPFVQNIGWANLRTSRAPYVPELKHELDTRHFEQSSQSCEPENYHPMSSAGSAGSRMPVNDFTYRCYRISQFAKSTS